MGIISKIRGRAVYGDVQTLYGGLGKQVLALTATQVKNLYTTPLAIVPAPGAGKVTSVVEVVAKYVFGTTAFTGSNNLEFRYTSSNGAKVSADIDAAFLLAASGTNYRTVKGVVTELTPVANAPIVVNVPSANPGQGLGTLTLTVFYRTITP